jgi:hypothetical protein
MNSPGSAKSSVPLMMCRPKALVRRRAEGFLLSSYLLAGTRRANDRWRPRTEPSEPGFNVDQRSGADFDRNEIGPSQRIINGTPTHS